MAKIITITNQKGGVGRSTGGWIIIPQNEIISILASLIYVDYIIIFNEETPSQLISIIKSDAIIKEEEYKVKKYQKLIQ